MLAATFVSLVSLIFLLASAAAIDDRSSTVKNVYWARARMEVRRVEPKGEKKKGTHLFFLVRLLVLNRRVFFQLCWKTLVALYCETQTAPMADKQREKGNEKRAGKSYASKAFSLFCLSLSLTVQPLFGEKDVFLQQ
jgi:hypothetical protein